MNLDKSALSFHKGRVIYLEGGVFEILDPHVGVELSAQEGTTMVALVCLENLVYPPLVGRRIFRRVEYLIKNQEEPKCRN